MSVSTGSERGRRRRRRGGDDGRRGRGRRPPVRAGRRRRAPVGAGGRRRRRRWRRRRRRREELVDDVQSQFTWAASLAFASCSRYCMKYCFAFSSCSALSNETATLNRNAGYRWPVGGQEALRPRRRIRRARTRSVPTRTPPSRRPATCRASLPRRPGPRPPLHQREKRGGDQYGGEGRRLNLIQARLDGITPIGIRIRVDYWASARARRCAPAGRGPAPLVEKTRVHVDSRLCGCLLPAQPPGPRPGRVGVERRERDALASVATATTRRRNAGGSAPRFEPALLAQPPDRLVAASLDSCEGRPRATVVALRTPVGSRKPGSSSPGCAGTAASQPCSTRETPRGSRSLLRPGRRCGASPPSPGPRRSFRDAALDLGLAAANRAQASSARACAAIGAAFCPVHASRFQRHEHQQRDHRADHAVGRSPRPAPLDPPPALLAQPPDRFVVPAPGFVDDHLRCHPDIVSPIHVLPSRGLDRDAPRSYRVLMPSEPIREVTVLGAGVMGAAIAAHLANAGLRVRLLDIPAKDAPPATARRATRSRPPGWKGRARPSRPHSSHPASTRWSPSATWRTTWRRPSRAATW